MNYEQKKRLHKLLKTCGLWLAAGVLYYLFVRLTGWGIPCLITKVTGGLCPGCGITRMVFALVQGNIPLAARNNLLVLCLLPFAALFCLRRGILFVKNGNTQTNLVETICLVLALLLTIAFWILRNQPAFWYLMPV